jgi:hypothetical protein
MLLAVLGSVGLLATGIAAAGPALADVRAAGAPVAAVVKAPVKPPSKAAPVRPPSTAGATSGTALPAKPARKLSTGAIAQPAAAAGWSVSLTTNITTLWPTQYATLTATASMDVGPTPYYIRIYDVYRAQYVATCGWGTVCTVPVTNTVGTVLRFVALISDGSATYPPGSIQATSFNVDIDWRTYIDNLHLTVDASVNTSPVGGQSVVTARTAEDVGPSPFYILLFDTTTRNLLGACPAGTFCSLGITKNVATTHMYTAYLGSSWTGTVDQTQQLWVNSDPTGVEATSPFMYVTWTSSGWTVSLTASAVVNNSQTVTATANGNVGPTPYWIEIFSIPTNHLIGVCGSGSVCSFTFTPSYNTGDLQAFVTSFTNSISPQPPGIQASSNLVNV